MTYVSKIFKDEFKAAERLLEGAYDFEGEEVEKRLLMRAQVRATLALAAATYIQYTGELPGWDH